jgi:hypothetical protein
MNLTYLLTYLDSIVNWLLLIGIFFTIFGQKYYTMKRLRKLSLTHRDMIISVPSSNKKQIL